ncbi:hypothetical protein DOS80_04935 [Staphylococcus felis]|nr:hypothetical protein DOS80_04935 [Staphylococcus felis]
MKMKIKKVFYEDLDRCLFNFVQNGVRITYFNLDSAYINLIKAVVNIGGEQYEPGTAHFIEHLKFWKEGVNLYDLMNRFGTILNANTTECETNFLLYCSKKDTYTTLMNFTSYLLNHRYTYDEFNKEKKIISNEIKRYYSILKNEKEKMKYVKKILGNLDHVNSISKEYLESVSSSCYQKNNIHYYFIGDFSGVIDGSVDKSKEKMELVVDDTLISHSYDNIELFLKIRYLCMNNYINYFVKNKTIIINFRDLTSIKATSGIKLDIFRTNVISYILKIYEDVNALLEFLEIWKVSKGDFTKIGNILENKEKLIELLNEEFIC